MSYMEEMYVNESEHGPHMTADIQGSWAFQKPGFVPKMPLKDGDG